MEGSIQLIELEDGDVRDTEPDDFVVGYNQVC